MEWKERSIRAALRILINQYRAFMDDDHIRTYFEIELAKQQQEGDN
jgi:hypothetical protein